MTAGQAGDNPQLAPLPDAIHLTGRLERHCGQPRRRPHTLTADKAHSHPSTRAELRRRGIHTVIPERCDQVEHCRARGRRGGRPPRFDAETYRGHNVVERAFNRLKRWRGLATTSAARNYRAGLLLDAIASFWAK